MAFFHYSFLILALLITPSLSHAQESETQSTPILIENAYAFATMPGATTGAAFMEITNNGTEDDRLLNATSKVSKITEVHENLIDPDDGTMMMRKIKALDIPAGETVILEPTGYHIMFIKMKEPLTRDANVGFTLEFEKAGKIPVTAKIMAPGIKPRSEKEMPWDQEKQKQKQTNQTE